jgi:pimeloyl-ACP methyl ester carboxylesterase
MYYEEVGSGPPLLLSPGGLQGVLASYQPVIAALSQAHRVIAYDRRFGGQSTSPLVVQTWDMVCQDVIGLMNVLSIETAYLGGGSFGAAIAFGCAVRYPQRVQAIFPSNIAGGLICHAYLAMKLFKSAEMALTQGIKAVVDACDPHDRFAPFTPERAQYDAMYRQRLEAMPPEDFAHVMRDTIYALFDGPYLTGPRSVRMPRSRTHTSAGSCSFSPRSRETPRIGPSDVCCGGARVGKPMGVRRIVGGVRTPCPAGREVCSAMEHVAPVGATWGRQGRRRPVRPR